MRIQGRRPFRHAQRNFDVQTIALLASGMGRLMDGTADPAPGTSPLALTLARLRMTWDQLDRRNAVSCSHSWRGILLVHIATNGARHVYEGCAVCGAPTAPGQWLSCDEVDAGTLPVAVDRRYQNPPCVVCGTWGTELHHWAPRAVFGDESHHWPTAWLCPGCHADWHRRITQRESVRPAS
jgi:hypothetical protein